jgi:hypothetical protein
MYSSLYVVGADGKRGGVTRVNIPISTSPVLSDIDSWGAKLPVAAKLV